MIKRAPSVAALLAAASFLASAWASAQDAAAPAAAKDPCRSRLVGMPFFFYTPETKLAFGGGGVWLAALLVQAR